MSILTSLLPSVVSSAISWLGGEQRNDAQQQAALQQMAFQAEMSSTAYQRAVKDMQLAGLNPMLAYSQGGASAPIGAMPQFENVGAAAAQGASSGAAASRAVAEIELVEAQADKARSEADLNRAELPWVEPTRSEGVQVQSAHAGLMREQRQQVFQDTLRVINQANLLVEQAKLTEVERKLVVQQVLNAIAEEREIEARTGNLRVDTVLKQLDVPRMQNLAEAEKTWVKRNISPYVHDIGEFSRAGRDLAIGGRAVRGIPGMPSVPTGGARRYPLPSRR